jgi:hypothetical protein
MTGGMGMKKRREMARESNRAKAQCKEQGSSFLLFLFDDFSRDEDFFIKVLSPYLH